MMRRIGSLIIAGASATLVGGCISMAPTYHRPASPVPAALTTDRMNQTVVDELKLPGWRDVFVDPRLQKVLGLALTNNRDLRIAILNVEKDRAAYRIQAADQLPTITGGASYMAERTSTGGVPLISRSTSVSVGISSWELDLFGRIKSLKNEALETWLATREAQRETRLSLLAQVAGQWLTVASYQQRLGLAKETFESQSETLRLSRLLHEAGTASGVDVAQVEGSVESAREDVASFTTSLAQAKNSLDLLVGTPVPDRLLSPAGLPNAVVLAPVPANLSSNALLARPDITDAEHVLKAANADIGAARADFFPSITLTGSTGRSSSELSGLFERESRAWSFVPGVSIPIFSFGKIRSRFESAKIQNDVAVAEYEKTIQTAFQEAADALAVRRNISEQLDAQKAFVAASRRGYELSKARYTAGLDNYLAVLDSQRSLYSEQQNLISLSLEEETNRIKIYKVFGGGAEAKASDF